MKIDKSEHNGEELTQPKLYEFILQYFKHHPHNVCWQVGKKLERIHLSRTEPAIVENKNGAAQKYHGQNCPQCLPSCRHHLKDPSYFESKMLKPIKRVRLHFLGGTLTFARFGQIKHHYKTFSENSSILQFFGTLFKNPFRGWNYLGKGLLEPSAMKELLSWLSSKASEKKPQEKNFPQKSQLKNSLAEYPNIRKSSL